jgi:hypothetical protein
MVKENLQLRAKVVGLESKIAVLEDVTKKHSKNFFELHSQKQQLKSSLQPNKPKSSRNAKITAPQSHDNKTLPKLPLKNPLERPAEQKSKLPWIKSAVRISQKRPKLRKPLHFSYQQHTIDFSLISETEKVVKTRPPTKTEVNPCFHSTNSWKVLEEDQEDLDQPAPTIPEEKLIRLEQLFLESMNELIKLSQPQSPVLKFT